MKKEMNNKGFSLVELIIVIAIMAVLVGLLAPQYLKYVHNSKVSADVTNAQSIATAFNVAMADGATLDASYSGAGNGTVGGTLPSDFNMTTWPETKMVAGSTWKVDIDANGVSSVTLTIASGSDAGTWECYPNPDDTADGLNTRKK